MFYKKGGRKREKGARMQHLDEAKGVAIEGTREGHNQWKENAGAIGHNRL